MTLVKTRNTCRVCGSTRLKPILTLGNQYVSDFVDSSSQEQVEAPLELVLCRSCNLLQLKHTVSGEVLYRHYWYRSGVNASMKLALSEIAEDAEHLVKLDALDIVLDIGCNDGTLLRAYKTKQIYRFGFEPAVNLCEEAMIGTSTIINDFFNYKTFYSRYSRAKAKIISAIAMFYDLDDPNRFVEDIKKTLHKNGVFIIQMNYMPLMLKNNAFDNICHEHLEYYSLHSLEYLLKKHHLEVFDVKLNEVNGGSFRVYVKHKDCSFYSVSERVQWLWLGEEKQNLDTIKPYKDFERRVQHLKVATTRFIKKQVNLGKKVFVYGASTKGNTLLQYYGLNFNLIKAAAERSPDKYGKKTVGTLIPIISEAEARRAKPDYFLVLPWHFLGEFLKREHEFLEGGGKFIVPLPNFQVIGKEEVEKCVS